ncbi:MAG: type II toxin-antitoxin system VapC family toxin [Ignavibacteria bacterium]|nr:type II toxin-antitoxin system VapC family toxin [Ignavibacteria bacterium]
MNQDKTRKQYILDTSALLTYIEDEDGADKVDALLIEAENGEADIYIAFISITEVYYITLQEKDEIEALRRVILIQRLAVKIVESYEAINLAAGKLKAINRISLADSYIAAVCRAYSGTLVHKDPEFEKLSPPIDEYRLPYKSIAI